MDVYEVDGDGLVDVEKGWEEKQRVIWMVGEPEQPLRIHLLSVLLKLGTKPVENKRRRVHGDLERALCKWEAKRTQFLGATACMCIAKLDNFVVVKKRKRGWELPDKFSSDINLIYKPNTSRIHLPLSLLSSSSKETLECFATHRRVTHRVFCDTGSRPTLCWFFRAWDKLLGLYWIVPLRFIYYPYTLPTGGTSIHTRQKQVRSF